MKTIAICDDSKEWLGRASKIVSDYSRERGMDAHVVCYNDIDRCIEELSPDAGVLFMDIEWDIREPEGIRAAAEINRRYPNCRIVYLTNHLGYALDVYQTEHTWYVLKEQFAERLPEVFEKIKALDDERKQDIVVRTDEGNTMSLLCKSICYIERVGRKTKIVTDDAEITVREKISEIEDVLPCAGFGRCHNSIIVSFAKVRAIYKSSLTLTNDAELLISRGHNKDFRKRYMDWAGGRQL